MALNARHVRWVIAAISVRACTLEQRPSALQPRCVKSCLKPASILPPTALRSRALFQAEAPIFIAAGKRFLSMQTGLHCDASTAGLGRLYYTNVGRRDNPTEM